MDLLSMMEPITYENLNELKPGEWIWDTNLIERRPHKRTLGEELIIEPIGFRQIHILDLDDIAFTRKIFMLTNIDYGITGYKWEYFEVGRFYKFKGDRK